MHTFSNVRELENIIERAFALGAIDEIQLADLPGLVLEQKSSTPQKGRSGTRPLRTDAPPPEEVRVN